ncbi:hypothetical protein X798_02570 [Onchocerca flexuosa]|uniref:Uncharacterized protein n=1 Tax=Onchocerca flexuosa TaxID=387005 RepID=A0A238BYE6_9BILA|nr:hypothetical protein X798_02570 [Onchocerca flexuosa]
MVFLKTVMLHLVWNNVTLTFLIPNPGWRVQHKIFHVYLMFIFSSKYTRVLHDYCKKNFSRICFFANKEQRNCKSLLLCFLWKRQHKLMIKSSWTTICNHTGDNLYQLAVIKFKDLVKDGGEKIKKDYDELLKTM